MTPLDRRGRRSSRSAAARRAAWRVLALLTLLLLPNTACRRSASLANTAESPRVLAQAVLEAFASRDQARLVGLALDESEFRALVWPELPVARPERNMPFEYVWSDLNQKSRARLSELLATHGGKHYTLVDITFTGETTQYATFLVRRDSELTVRDETGAPQVLRLFGSVLQTGDGRYKVFSYNVDD